MRCLAIDDEPKALTVIRHYAEKMPTLQLLGAFRSGVDALQFLATEAVDLIFLDINMPDLTGIELLQTLARPPLVIFTTAYSEYAVQSYDWDAVGYLLKPIEFPKFVKAVHKVQAQITNKPTVVPALTSVPLAAPEYILIKSGAQTYQVKLSDILYLEAAGNHVLVVTTERKIMTLTSLQEIAKLLPPAFYRVHKSFIVALPHVQVIESYQVKIKGVAIPIGKTYREAFLTEFKR